jgi:hypothetical protein
MCHAKVKALLDQIETCIYEDRHQPDAIRHDHDLTEVAILVSQCLTILELRTPNETNNPSS